MLRLVIGFTLSLGALVMLGRVGAFDGGFPLTMLVMAPVILLGGLLMGLHEEPPPWRRRPTAR